jgi:hypothetical protein
MQAVSEKKRLFLFPKKASKKTQQALLIDF